jgi:hypothetical protein
MHTTAPLFYDKSTPFHVKLNSAEWNFVSHPPERRGAQEWGRALWRETAVAYDEWEGSFATLSTTKHTVLSVSPHRGEEGNPAPKRILVL